MPSARRSSAALRILLIWRVYDCGIPSDSTKDRRPFCLASLNACNHNTLHHVTLMTCTRACMQLQAMSSSIRKVGFLPKP